MHRYTADTDHTLLVPSVKKGIALGTLPVTNTALFVTFRIANKGLNEGGGRR